MNTGRVSKFLSLVLRHKPEEIGIQLDSGGWVSVDSLLSALSKTSHAISREQLEEVVATNNKKRFTFSHDGKSIRASQGHSIDVDLGLQIYVPSGYLYHGTATRFLESIFANGLEKRNRHHVHLSEEYDTALSVGKRHGKPVVLTVSSAEMLADGFVFYKSENGVVLTDHVPPSYLMFCEG